MAAQSLLAKLGMRLSTLGTSASLAFAFPLATNDPSMGAHTDANRMGLYADRTPGSEKVGHIILGTEVFTVSTRGVSSNRSAVLQNEMFGLNAGNTGMTGLSNTLVGYTAGLGLTVGDSNVVVGAGALATGLTSSDSVAIGYRALNASDAANNVALGSGAGEFMSSGTGNIFLGTAAGDGTSITASNRFVAGSSVAAIQDVFFGNGEVNAAPLAYTLHGVGGLGADIAGGAVNVAGGQGTGTGVGGAINFRTAKASTTSSTPNALATRLSVLQDGAVDWTGIATASAPALSAANHGTIYYDTTTGMFMASTNGGAYSALGSGSGTVTSVGVISTDLSVSGSPVTTSGNITLNINAGAVTLAKMANLAANSIIGNNTGAGATPLALTGTQVTAMLDNFTAVAKGLVPLSGGGTTNFLRADGTWAAAGTGTIAGSIAADQVAVGSAANTIAGSNNLKWSTANGLVSNRSSAPQNEMYGIGAGNTTMSGFDNTLVGANAGKAITTGSMNTVVGSAAGFVLAGGQQNTYLGEGAGFSATTGDNNTGVGVDVLIDMVGGYENTAVGHHAGGEIIGGFGNSILGDQALRGLTTGSNNIALGRGAGTTLATATPSTTNTMFIGDAVTNGGTDVINNVYIASSNTFGAVFRNRTQFADGVTWQGLITASAPPVSAASTGTIYYNSTLQRFQVSENGAAYANLGAGTIGGTISANQVAVGSGTDTIAGSSALLWTSAGGITANRSAVATNEMFGKEAGNTTLTGFSDTLVGYQAGTSLTSGDTNTFIGYRAGWQATNVGSNTVIGARAFENATSNGVRNVVIGFRAMLAAYGDNCVAIGADALGSGGGLGAQNTAVGSQSIQGNTGGAYNTALGALTLSSSTSGDGNTALGTSAGANLQTGQYNVFIGYGSGDSTATGASNRFVSGSVNAPISSVYIGNGETASAPQSITYLATGGAGANVAGASLTLAGGAGTGSGVGGAINFQTAKASGSSSTPNTLITRHSILQDGAVDWTGIATVSAPAVSAANHGTIYYDTTTGTFRASVNGGAYVDLIGATAAAGSSTQVQFNTSGALDAVAGLTFDKTAITLSVTGTGSPTALTDLMIQSSDTQNIFIQNNIQNLSNGIAASSDWIATSDTGNDTTNFVDMGINGSGWATGSWTINGANDGYVYSGTTGLAVGCAATGQSLRLFTGGTLLANARQTITDTTFVLAPGAATSGSAVGFTYTGPANTTLTTLTEVNDWNINLARTVQWATGAIATQRAIRIQAPTYAFVAASTITTASTLAISNAPVAGTNATLTNRYALLIESGAINAPVGTAALPSYSLGQANTGMYSTGAGFIGFSSSGTLRLTIDATAFTGTLPWRGQNGTAGAPAFSFSGDTNCGIFEGGADIIGFAGNGVEIARIQTTSTQTSGNLNVAPAVVTSGAACAFRVVTPADTAQTASTEASSVIFDFTTSRQFATGALTTQRAVRIVAPTYAFVGASTITNAATVAITGGPVAGTNATITNRYAFWVQAQNSRFDGDVIMGTAGNGLSIKEGTNAKMGIATLVGGTVVVSTTAVTANSRIYLTSNVDGGTPGFVRVSARTGGTSFTITSSSGTDTSQIGWLIVEPAP